MDEAKLIIESLRDPQESSIEFSESAKGRFQVSVKAYGKTPEEVRVKLAELLKIAEALRPADRQDPLLLGDKK